MKSKSIRTKSLSLMLAATALYCATASASPTKRPGEAGSNGEVASPLYREADQAIKAHDHRRLQVLLNKKPSLTKSMPRAKSGRRSSLIESAIYWEDEVSVRLLLEKGADPNGKEGAIPLDTAIIRLNGLPHDAPDHEEFRRLYVPSEAERFRQRIKKSQLTRARIILLLLNAGADYNVASSVGDKEVPNLFESLTMSLCDSIYHDPEVLALFRESGVVFKRNPGSETIFRQYILVNARNGILDPACVIFMYGR